MRTRLISIGFALAVLGMAQTATTAAEARGFGGYHGGYHGGFRGGYHGGFRGGYRGYGYRGYGHRGFGGGGAIAAGILGGLVVGGLAAGLAGDAYAAPAYGFGSTYDPGPNYVTPCRTVVRYGYTPWGDRVRRTWTACD